MVNIDPADDALAAGNEYSSGFVMAITEFKISGVSGVVPALPTHKFDALADCDDGGGALVICDGDVTISTFTIGMPFMLSLKL